MAVTPEKIEVNKCYRTSTGEVRRVIDVSNDEITFEVEGGACDFLGTGARGNRARHSRARSSKRSRAIPTQFWVAPRLRFQTDALPEIHMA